MSSVKSRTAGGWGEEQVSWSCQCVNCSVSKSNCHIISTSQPFPLFCCIDWCIYEEYLCATDFMSV